MSVGDGFDRWRPDVRLVDWSETSDADLSLAKYFCVFSGIDNRSGVRSVGSEECQERLTAVQSNDSLLFYYE